MDWIETVCPAARVAVDDAGVVHVFDATAHPFVIELHSVTFDFRRRFGFSRRQSVAHDATDDRPIGVDVSVAGVFHLLDVAGSKPSRWSRRSARTHRGPRWTRRRAGTPSHPFSISTSSLFVQFNESRWLEWARLKSSSFTWNQFIISTWSSAFHWLFLKWFQSGWFS